VSERLRAIVVTGLSGSGKSTALHVLEDLGFYCIDNLPVSLVPRVVDLWESARETVGRVALGIDAREGRFLGEFPRVFEELRAADVAVEVLYFEASDEVLVRRFSETRRPHPAAPSGTVEEGIRREREALRALREVADRIVDTSALTVHELRAALRDQLARLDTPALTVSLVSFGYKYGLPIDADLVFDTRFLPNPHWVEELRHLPGTDAKVRDYVLQYEEAKSYIARIEDLLEFLLPAFIGEGKHYLTIALGCTGGHHRSVVLAEEIARFVFDLGHPVSVHHRDLERE